MSLKKSIVLFVEGEGDAAAVPLLIKKLITDHNLWDRILIDPFPFRVGEVTCLLRNNGSEWTRLLGAARKRGNLGGILLVLDGDTKLAKSPFCPFEAGCRLSELAKSSGAGQIFSVTSVFATKEFESWLIAGVESLAGCQFPDGRLCIRTGVTAPEGDLEKAPRDAKGWLRDKSVSGYKPTRDQELLTNLVDIGLIRQRQMRSFMRLENALRQIAAAFESGNHIVTPVRKA